jgi:YHS domain-containing protein
MFRFFVFIILIYVLYKVIKNVGKLKPVKKGNYQFKASPDGGEDLVEDPVCHTYVPLGQAFKKEISGNDYYFCSKQCSEKYELGKNHGYESQSKL